ncbi:RNA polymerase sigma factor [Celeribacter baekdonensis]|jgi:RNA polymerase sigma-70 factor, ECF subfamily|nr:RNA polymerase sigma factor [Celeribacter baekdonensis]|tara:strand:- start:10891 stop:11442 length:552 start_codon:yes stop_codon:yes gene_type:complete
MKDDMRAKRGSPEHGMTPEAFKAEMIPLLPRLRRFALSLTRSNADADDLLQEACATALQKWQSYDPMQPMDRWLFRLVRNIWISEIRKRNVRHGRGLVPAEDSTELRTDETSEDRLNAIQVQAKVSDLPDELAQPLMLVCAEGYSYREVADLLDIPIGTVMSRVHRARKTLAAHFSASEVTVQ